MPESNVHELSESENDFVLQFRSFMDANPGLTFEEARFIALQSLIREIAIAESLLSNSEIIF